MSHAPDMHTKTTDLPKTQESQALAPAPCSAGLVLRLRSVADDECQEDEWLATVLRQSADEIERLRDIAARMAAEMRIAVAHMDSLHSENNQLRAICADLLPWARGCTTSNPARAKAVKLAEAVVLPNAAGEPRPPANP